MNKQWTLFVENFAKIKNAHITLADMMFFVGDNNSGKSYIMSLLWGILTYGKDLFPTKPSDAVAYKRCESWISDNVGKNLELTENEICIFLDWFNHILSTNSKQLVKRIFNYEMEIGKIEIVDYKRKSGLSIRWNDSGERYFSNANVVSFPMKESYMRDDYLKMCMYICWNILMEGVAAPLYTPKVKGRRTGEPVYLPASRTGFMLTFSQLVEASLGMFFSTLELFDENKLTMPYVDFLTLITKFEDVAAPKHKSLVEYIEKNMIEGRVGIQEGYFPIFKYTPAGGKKDMPLYTTSSVVAEISPILLLLKSNIKFNTLIIEEPEAHLHPALQAKMARLIMRLANNGINTWVTTHSDVILQQINNMIKLNNNEDSVSLSAKFGYDNQDIVNSDKIRMYQFSRNCKGKTDISSLSATKYGFVVPTFNEALENITEEVWAFQEGLE